MKKVLVTIVVCALLIVSLSACIGFPLQNNGSTESKSKKSNATTVGPEKEEGSLQTTEEAPLNLVPSNANISDFSIGGLKYICDVYYGMFPQTRASKYAVRQMSRITDATGYYYSAYDGEHYAKVTSASVYGNKYEFMDEDPIKPGETYYFKVEPIKWHVIGQVDVLSGTFEVLLLSDLILDGMEFCSKYKIDDADNEWYNTESGTFANNWAYSDVRKWLNKDFYKVAFTAEEKERLIPRETSEVCDIYDPDDPTENVYTLTYAQAVSLGNVQAKVSDYARCRDTFMTIYAKYYGNGRWWLCTPGDKSYKVAYASDHNFISDSGEIIASDSGESAGLEAIGVRPVIQIKLTQELLQSILVPEEED